MEENSLHLLEILEKKDKKLLLMILNQPLEFDFTLLESLWQKAVYKISVDGGTNELFRCTKDNRDNFLPNVISGDLDSLKPDVAEFYKNKGLKVIETEDQNYTDFTKGLRIAVQQTESMEIDYIVVFGAFGGRMDQVFANIDTLYQAQKITKTPVVLISHCQLATLLGKGRHRLHFGTGFEGDWNGLVPVGCPAEHVTTTGLKWNLENQSLQFGHLISTSNTFDESGSGIVTVETDKELMWLMEIKNQ